MRFSQLLFRGLLGILLCLGTGFHAFSQDDEDDSFSYRGWEGALRASNEALEIVVLPQTGRLIHLSSPGKDNLFTFDEALVGQLPPAEEGDWLNYGGDWMWVVHQDVLTADLSKLTLRPGQARIFRIRHEQEVR